MVSQSQGCPRLWWDYFAAHQRHVHSDKMRLPVQFCSGMRWCFHTNRLYRWKLYKIRGRGIINSQAVSNRKSTWRHTSMSNPTFNSFLQTYRTLQNLQLLPQQPLTLDLHFRNLCFRTGITLAPMSEHFIVQALQLPLAHHRQSSVLKTVSVALSSPYLSRSHHQYCHHTQKLAAKPMRPPTHEQICSWHRCTCAGRSCSLQRWNHA